MNTFKILSCYRQLLPSLMLTKLSKWTASSREGSRTTSSSCSGTTSSSWRTTTGPPTTRSRSEAVFGWGPEVPEPPWAMVFKVTRQVSPEEVGILLREPGHILPSVAGLQVEVNYPIWDQVSLGFSKIYVKYFYLFSSNITVSSKWRSTQQVWLSPTHGQDLGRDGRPVGGLDLGAPRDEAVH